MDDRGGAAHADADMGVGEGGDIVDTVAGHGDDFGGFHSGEDFELELGGDAGEDGGGFDDIFDIVVAGMVEVAAIEDLAGVFNQAELFAYLHGGDKVVAGNHFDGDASGESLFDGGDGFGAERIGDRDEAEKDEPFAFG